MPIRIESPHDGLGVIYTCEGFLRLQHFSEANNRLLASRAQLRKLRYVIVDAALMEPQYFSPSQLDSIGMQARQIASYAVPGLLVALVAEQSVVLGLARMWEVFIEGIDWERKFFPSVAEAQRWIRFRVKDKFQLDLA